MGCTLSETEFSGPDRKTTTYNPLSTISDVSVEQQLAAQKSENDTKNNPKNEVVPVVKDNTIIDDATKEISVHFIDVGQADSIFIDYGEVDVLIDGGNNADGELVVNYLKSLGTDDIELIVATHPHEDHIGGLDTVINYFDIEKIIKPDLAENTQTNKDFEIAISNKNIPVENPGQGETIEFGELKFIVLSDKTKIYNDTNNFSIVLKMVYGDTSFLFTGDAESDVERDILQSGLDIKADVLKVGHHGSASSTTASFLKKVSPDYAVISVGIDNSYGHPDSITINRLNLHDIATMQTKDMGTIVFNSNGTDLIFTTNKEGTNPVAIDNTESGTATTNPTTGKTTTGTVAANSTETNEHGTDTTAEQSNTEKSPAIVISNLDKRAEFVEIANKSQQSIDLTGWYIVSVTGNQTFYFPDGYILEAGKSIKIASADAVGDIQWTTANIWNNSKSDPAKLYNKLGVLVHEWNN